MSAAKRKPRLRIPSHVTICGNEYRVLDKKLTEGTYGELPEGDLEEIHIDLSQHRNQHHADKTVLHEVLHAILYVSGQSACLDYSESKDKPGDQEEGIVHALENALPQIYDITVK